MSGAGGQSDLWVRVCRVDGLSLRKRVLGKPRPSVQLRLCSSEGRELSRAHTGPASSVDRGASTPTPLPAHTSPHDHTGVDPPVPPRAGGGGGVGGGGSAPGCPWAVQWEPAVGSSVVRLSWPSELPVAEWRGLALALSVVLDGGPLSFLCRAPEAVGEATVWVRDALASRPLHAGAGAGGAAGGGAGAGAASGTRPWGGSGGGGAGRGAAPTGAACSDSAGVAGGSGLGARAGAGARGAPPPRPPVPPLLHCLLVDPGTGAACGTLVVQVGLSAEEVGAAVGDQLTRRVKALPQDVVGVLGVRVLRGTDLANRDTLSQQDPYVTLSLQCVAPGDTGPGTCLSRARTATLRRGGVNPAWGPDSGWDVRLWFAAPAGSSVLLLVAAMDEDVGRDDVIGVCELDVGRLTLKEAGFARSEVQLALRATLSPASVPCGTLTVNVHVIADTALCHYAASRMQAVFRMRAARRRYLQVPAPCRALLGGVPSHGALRRPVALPLEVRAQC
jgi:hypothetical protein